MKKACTRIALGVIAACSFSQASAAVLTFNDLPTFPKPGGGTTGSFFDDTSLITDYTYKGFRFANENGSRWFWNPETNAAGDPYAGVGGSTWVGVNTTANGVTPSDNLQPAITSAVDFVFNGASFTGYDPVRFLLYLDDNLVSTSSDCVLPGTQVPKFCASGYSGLVDKLVIVNVTPAGFDAGSYFAMDNFTYNEPSLNVPEPGSAALVAGALAAAALVLRRRQQA